MSKMRAMIVPEIRGRFRMVERDLPEPGRTKSASAYMPAASATATPSPSKVLCLVSPFRAFPAMKSSA